MSVLNAQHLLAIAAIALMFTACGGRQKTAVDEHLAWSDIYDAAPADAIGVMGKYQGEGGLPFDFGDDAVDDFMSNVAISAALQIDTEHLNGEVLKFLTLDQEWEVIGVHDASIVMEALQEAYAQDAGVAELDETRYGKRPILYFKEVQDWQDDGGYGVEVTTIGNHIIKVSTPERYTDTEGNWKQQIDADVQAFIQGWPERQRFADTQIGKQLRPRDIEAKSRPLWLALNTKYLNALAEKADEDMSDTCKEANRWFEELIPGGGVVAYRHNGHSLLHYKVYLSEKARTVLSNAIPKTLDVRAIQENSLLSFAWALSYDKLKDQIHVNPAYLECDSPVAVLGAITDDGMGLASNFGILSSILFAGVIEYLGESGALAIESINLDGMIPLPNLIGTMATPKAEPITRDLMELVDDPEVLTVVSDKDPLIIELAEASLPNFFRLHIEAHPDHMYATLGVITDRMQELMRQVSTSNNGAKTALSVHLNEARIKAFIQDLDRYRTDMELDDADIDWLRNALDHVKGGGAFSLSLDGEGLHGIVDIGDR